MNTVKLSRTDDGRAKVTVVSEGERDLSAVVSIDELLSQLTNLQDPANANPASQETPLEQD